MAIPLKDLRALIDAYAAARSRADYAANEFSYMDNTDVEHEADKAYDVLWAAIESIHPSITAARAGRVVTEATRRASRLNGMKGGRPATKPTKRT